LKLSVEITRPVGARSSSSSSPLSRDQPRPYQLPPRANPFTSSNAAAVGNARDRSAAAKIGWASTLYQTTLMRQTVQRRRGYKQRPAIRPHKQSAVKVRCSQGIKTCSSISQDAAQNTMLEQGKSLNKAAMTRPRQRLKEGAQSARQKSYVPTGSSAPVHSAIILASTSPSFVARQGCCDSTTPSDMKSGAGTFQPATNPAARLHPNPPGPRPMCSRASSDRWAIWCQPEPLCSTTYHFGR